MLSHLLDCWSFLFVEANGLVAHANFIGDKEGLTDLRIKNNFASSMVNNTSVVGCFC